MTRTSRPRRMARRSLLVGSVILAGAAATALGVNGASAQAAPDTCTVNAVPVAGPIITGTAGADTIDCAEATGTRTIHGLAGSDTITGSPHDDTINLLESLLFHYYSEPSTSVDLPAARSAEEN